MPKPLAEQWREFARYQKRREEQILLSVRKALKQQVQQFIAGGYTPEAITIMPLLPVLRSLYVDAARIIGGNTYNELRKEYPQRKSLETKARLPLGFNTFLTGIIERFFAVDMVNTAQEITDTVRNRLVQILQRQAREGYSIEDTTKLITSQGFTENQARTIARTETVRAANFATHEGAKATGLVLNKVWVSAQDNRTRRVPRNTFDHLHMNGVQTDFNGLFTVSGEKLEYPGDRKNGASAGNTINCRCTHGHVALRDAQGRLLEA